MKQDARVVAGVKSMSNFGDVRRLNREEHILTRPLWERIFTEDSKEFLDYYYSVKTKENEIYVIEDGNVIVAMLHLNPYQMRIGQEIYDTHYIVAVATDERFRRRGLMARLMNHVLQEMTERNEPFTFLMPANEAYYKPFGFQTVLQKEDVGICGSDGLTEQLVFCKACEMDCKAMADYANRYLKKYGVATHRTERYYLTLLTEHTCEGGGILLIKEGDRLVGMVPYFGEKADEIKGPMLENENHLQQAVFYLTGEENKEVICKQFPFMIKVLHPEWESLLKNPKVFLDEVV